VHKDTLLRWLRTGLVPEPRRDRHGWRKFTEEQARSVVAFARQEGSTWRAAEEPAPYAGKAEISRLLAINWDFADAKTIYLTHGLHPYPAKFIPQIPNALIQELSSVGETVADIFCGSGTTLVEALILKRNAVGIDANPLACLISQGKTGLLQEEHAEQLGDLTKRSEELARAAAISPGGSLFGNAAFSSEAWRPSDPALAFWFEPFVIEELAEILSWCRALSDETCRNLALTAFSSIVIAVSRQDSDTRYVRRRKEIKPGETAARFARSISDALRAAWEFRGTVESRFRCRVHCQNILDRPDIGQVDLVVCSPPYPNAYSYHLYHMTRMLWLGMDQTKFKKQEIGSHRKYSRKSNAATEDTFRREMSEVFAWLAGPLAAGGYACFVVGDSCLKGRTVDNAALIGEAAAANGFREAARISRRIQESRKSFNPAIGKIKTEHILILQNQKRREAACQS
jgi:site-specific DNA-methyltransferase (cytosine-N4-specific)